MTRILDLDLDYFLTGLCMPAEPGERPCEDVGAEDDGFVHSFMRESLGITRPVPGRVIETHDLSLSYWEELIREGRLEPPFEVVHVDAHSDLGIGRPGPNYVLYNVLSRAPASRLGSDQHREAGQLDEANYLLFALAMRLIARLDNVRRPFSQPDVPRMIVSGDRIHLPEPFPELFGMRNGREPDVPYREYTQDGSYRAEGGFDYMTLALSPRYVPRRADGLVMLIRQYIKEN